MQHYAAFHLGLHCLPMFPVALERINTRLLFLSVKVDERLYKTRHLASLEFLMVVFTKRSAVLDVTESCSHGLP